MSDKTYKKIDNTKLEEITTSSRIIDKEWVERELEAMKENLIENQAQIKGFEELLKKFK